MERLIAGRQIPICSDASRKLDEAGDSIREIAQLLRRNGLHEEAGRLDEIRRTAAGESVRLEQLARTAFCAARRGQELPN